MVTVAPPGALQTVRPAHPNLPSFHKKPEIQIPMCYLLIVFFFQIVNRYNIKLAPSLFLRVQFSDIKSIHHHPAPALFHLVKLLLTFWMVVTH